MRIKNAGSIITIVLLTAGLLGYWVYLSARLYFPIPDQQYQNINLITALAMVEVLIVARIFTTRVWFSNEPKRNLASLSIFAGLNSLMFTILFVTLISDPWLAALRVHATLLPMLPSLIILSAAVWLGILIRNPDLQLALLPEEPIDKFLVFAREPRHEGIFLISLFLIGVGIRLINISGYPPSNDEHYQLRAAFDILNGNPVGYSRAYASVSLPIAISFKLLGVSLLSARLPMILMNMLAIFPLYLLARKVDRWTGTMAVLLFILNPTIVALSQLARDYAMIPLFTYSILLPMSEVALSPRLLQLGKIFELFPYRFLFLAGILLYLFIGAKQSVLQANFILYVVFLGMIIIATLQNKIKKRLKIAMLLFGFATAIGLFLLPSRLPIHFTPEEGIEVNATITPLRALTWMPYISWSYYMPQIAILVIALGLFFLIRAIPRLTEPYNRFTFMNLAPFFAGLVYMSFFLYGDNQGRGLRYTVFLVELFIPFAAFVYVKAIRWTNTRLREQPIPKIVLMVGVFFLFTFNLPAFMELARFKGDAVFAVTDITHQRSDEVVEALSTLPRPGYHLVSDNFISALQLANPNVDISQFGPFSPVRKDKTTLLKAIRGHSEGWLMLSEDDAAAMGLDDKDFTIPGAEFVFKEKVSNGVLWRWKLSEPSPQ